MTAHWLLPVVAVLGLMYLIYFSIRSAVLSFQAPLDSPMYVSNHKPQQPFWKRLFNRSSTVQVDRVNHTRQSLRRKPVKQKLTELLTAMLISALLCAALCGVVMIIGGMAPGGSIRTTGFYAWATTTTVLGSWMVLALGKLWEGRESNSWRRRGFMAVAGVAMGAFSFAAAQLLMVQFDSPLSSESLFNDLYREWFRSGAPMLPAFLVQFAVLFGALRWWRQADPIRRTRLSLVAAGACVLVSLILPLPQPWSFMVAGVISVAVQVASPWLNEEKREEAIRQQLTA